MVTPVRDMLLSYGIFCHPSNKSRFRGAPGGLPGCSPPQTPKNQNKKKRKTDFVDIMISKVLCDFPFSRNQPLKSADD
jgi:hypothetical protein